MKKNKKEIGYPKTKSKQFIERLNRCVIVGPYPFVIDLANSQGMYLATVDGDRIFDWAGLYGSKLLGYNHPRLYEKDYLTHLQVAANNKLANPDFLTPECLAYYELIYSLAPKCMRNKKLEVYTVNSGAEAVENMMKYFINLHRHKIKKQKLAAKANRFIYFDGAFHGRTVFALNVTNVENDPMITKDFKGIIPGNIRVPFPAFDNSKSKSVNLKNMQQSLSVIDTMMDLHKDEIVGVILEPIQGAGGHRLALPDFYRELSILCHRHKILWGVDEVQTAGGQTGEIFCIDHYDLPHPPDAVATAKKFGNGVIYMRRSMDDLGVLDSTWGGTLSDMVRFCQEWKIVTEEGLLTAVDFKSNHLINGLKKLQDKFPSQITNVRGLGLYLGFSFKNGKAKGPFIERALQEENLLLLGAGSDSIRLRPVLDVTVSDIDRLLALLDKLLSGQKKFKLTS
ncbi:MAG: aminotransferase class III [Bdellovibrionales bacterium RIFOXYD12_FULL_39_22]|nr:MAG: aminotransferase class III [Bdellovibrionales bacterium RIFOXYB1_FULL_39_21]OFZ43809.1 MAG: aminotransferase class III [Bdellovibrionales bacterium RIFOXYC12_FULL_39_17]OFZ48857.1 MAG: aminotransferase class III [Bdellovibrionales bacterium RIFOXYC1_FULL_39_130]OFZ76590.1 MAG: aminotransferase class III [Bdellovibrionales bacterium RIFOXYD1_FULL_39_84]OFZ94824.1 MAG: aminotransferase class III [Bdellovibrionales bacterium RIFOXYD12_FULL_39_22]HLE12249.1 aminotransferase class III-fold 